MIRPLEEKDRAEVMDIWLQTSISAHHFIEEAYWKAQYDPVENIYLPMAQNFVWEEKKEVVGFVSLIQTQYIGAIFVKEGFCGKGIGKALIEFCKQSTDYLFLTVYSENKKSISFYKRCGFAQVKEQESGYPEHKELVMEWYAPKD